MPFVKLESPLCRISIRTVYWTLVQHGKCEPRQAAEKRHALEAKLRHAGVARQITKELTRRFEESRRNSLRAPKMRDDLGGEQDRESPKRLRFRRADFHVVFEIFERPMLRSFFRPPGARLPSTA